MKKIVLWILVVVILMQFIRPTKNNSSIGEHDISAVVKVPEEIKQLIKTSCADCHSNSTVYPWYSEIAPVSWYLAQHVNEGKEHLNFSEWGTYNKFQKEHILKDLEAVLLDVEMPLKSYLILHEEAKLTQDQYKTFLNWVKTIPVE